MTSDHGATAEELGVGDMVGPYRLEALLGSGAMGVVFRARRTGGVESVALKVLRAELTDDPTFRRRFEHEARSAGEVAHASLVRVLDAGEAHGRAYLAVEFVEGVTLAERIELDGPLPFAAVARLASEVGEALDVLHERGLVHRDVKSTNIMVREDGAALLTDFGLAKGRAYTVLTRPGQVLGTLDYLAPELIRGEPATPSTDVYAFGCSLYECLTGAPPFGGKSVIQIGIAHLEDPPPDPRGARTDLSSELADAVLQALEKDPHRRPASAGAYARAVSAAAGPEAS
jgi:serine/threonine protein kinase